MLKRGRSSISKSDRGRTASQPPGVRVGQREAPAHRAATRSGRAATSCGQALIPEVGFEPTRPFGQPILSRSRLPFRHSGRLVDRAPRRRGAGFIARPAVRTRGKEGVAGVDGNDRPDRRRTDRPEDDPLRPAVEVEDGAVDQHRQDQQHHPREDLHVARLPLQLLLVRQLVGRSPQVMLVVPARLRIGHRRLSISRWISSSLIPRSRGPYACHPVVISAIPRPKATQIGQK